MSSPLFRGITESAIGEFDEGFEILRLEDGQVLVRQGDLSQYLYLVVEGRLG